MLSRNDWPATLTMLWKIGYGGRLVFEVAAAVPQLSATSAAAAARRMVFMMVSPHLTGGRALASLPECTNTGIGWHVRWTGKCLNKSLKSR